MQSTPSLLLAVSLSLTLACGDKKDADKEQPSAKPTTKEPAKSGGDKVPTERQALALDEGDGKIPATIDAPKGSTIFADSPTSLRVDFGDGEAFSVRVSAGNEFNTNLEESATELAKNKYGNTNEIIEKSDTLLRYSMTNGGHTTHKFTLIVDLGGKKWVCNEGLFGGWSAEQAAAQLEVCKTLKAK